SYLLVSYALSCMYADGALRALHSFPTRRSSDLFSRRCGREVRLKAENLQRTGAFKIRGAVNRLAMLTPDERGAGVVAASARIHRSEEHTSELQSHLNLVCRLLLEKKKRRSTIVK